MAPKLLCGLLLTLVGLVFSSFCFIYAVMNPWNYNGINGLLGSFLGTQTLVPFIISTGHGCMYSVAPGLLYGANNACLCDAPLNHVDVAPPPWACAAWPCRIGCRGTIIPAM